MLDLVAQGGILGAPVKQAILIVEPFSVTANSMRQGLQSVGCFDALCSGDDCQ